MKLEKNEITRLEVIKSLFRCAKYSKDHYISRHVVSRSLEEIRRRDKVE